MSNNSNLGSEVSAGPALPKRGSSPTWHAKRFSFEPGKAKVRLALLCPPRRTATNVKKLLLILGLLAMAGAAQAEERGR